MTLHDLPTEITKPQLRVQTIAEFAAVDEETAKPIMGDEETCLLSHGGMMKIYGDGGAGKTTLEIDFLCHLAAGDDWLGISVPERCRILIIENEGPRGMFRKKLRRKLASWTGSPIEDHIYVLEDPWALFTFDEEVFREQLRLTIEFYEIDMVAAGPVQRLGIKGGGTPEEVAAFVYTIELVRTSLDRPCAAALVGHENKAGDVAGAWEGVPDTLVHVSNQGNGSTRLQWEKVRWGPALHGKTWQLAWADGETFERVEEEVRSDFEIEADILGFVSENPGCGWNVIDAAVEGRGTRKRDIRDRLISSSQLINKGRGNRFSLFASENANASHRPVRPPAGTLDGTQFGTSADQRRDRSSVPRPDSSRDATTGTHLEDDVEELDFGGRNGDDGDLPF